MADPVQGINRSDSAGPLSPTATGSSAPAVKPNGAPGGAASDLANVAKTEGLLQSMAQAAAGVPVVDEARVGALRDALAGGTFQPDPQLIAQRIVQLEATLAGDKSDT